MIPDLVPVRAGSGSASGSRTSGLKTIVVATVAFAGHRRGLVSIHSSIDAARSIACAMLGIPEEEITGEIPDAMGEVANMVAGTFRNKLAAITARFSCAEIRS